jgi:phasin family protein
MFPFLPQQASLFGTANLQTLLNVTKRYASGLQQLAELNTQTVKTVFEESASVLKAGSAATPGEFMNWQSSLIAAFPEKAAAYTRHFLTIIRSTEADILEETRTQFEQYGVGMKGVLDSAAQQGESAAQGTTELLSNIASASTQAVDETAEAVLDASGQIAQTSIDSTAEGVDAAREATETAAREATETASRTSKAGSKR